MRFPTGENTDRHFADQYSRVLGAALAALEPAYERLERASRTVRCLEYTATLAATTAAHYANRVLDAQEPQR